MGNIKEYIVKQVELTKLTVEKNQSLIANPEYSKQCNIQIKSLNEELLSLAKEISLNNKLGKLSELPVLCNVQSKVVYCTFANVLIIIV